MPILAESGPGVEGGVLSIRQQGSQTCLVIK
jgi:hypothetical protein